jgi:hypothetical protein
MEFTWPPQSSNPENEILFTIHVYKRIFCAITHFGQGSKSNARIEDCGAQVVFKKVLWIELSHTDFFNIAVCKSALIK